MRVSMQRILCLTQEILEQTVRLEGFVNFRPDRFEVGSIFVSTQSFYIFGRACYYNVRTYGCFD